jgi:hypothetical protein
MNATELNMIMTDMCAAINDAATRQLARSTALYSLTLEDKLKIMDGVETLIKEMGVKDYVAIN